MKKFKTILLVIAFLFALHFIRKTFFANERDVILERLDRIVELVNIKPNDGPLTGATKVNELIGMLSPGIEVAFVSERTGRKTFGGKDQIRQAFLGLSAKVPVLSVNHLGPRVTITGDRAEVITIGTAKGSRPSGSGTFDETLEVKLVFVKQGGEWLLDAGENTEEPDW